MKHAKANIVAVLGKPNPKMQALLEQLPASVNFFEIEADEESINAFDPAGVHDRKSIFKASPKCDDRAAMLRTASRRFDFVEVNPFTDQAVLQYIPPMRRIVTWSGTADSVDELAEIVRELTLIPASAYTIKFTPKHTEQAFFPLLLMQRLGRVDVTAYADGDAHLWTQLVGLHFGAPFVYGKMDESAKDVHHFGLNRLLFDYNLPTIRSINTLYGIVGSDVSKSLSPRMHNNTYEQVVASAFYLPFNVSDFKDFWEHTVHSKYLSQLGLEINGLTTVSPHKETACEVADLVASQCAQTMKSCNVLYKDERGWIGDTTDAFGVLHALAGENCETSGVKVAVVGCGGAGRSIACGLKTCRRRSDVGQPLIGARHAGIA